MFYLEPRTVTDAAASRLVVDVKVGHPFDAEVLPRMGHHVDRFVALDGAGAAEPMVGVDGRVPAGIVRWNGEPRLLAYRSHAVTHRMKRAAFVRYGEEEGLGHLMAAQPASRSGIENERYFRCAKALVGVPLASGLGVELAGRLVECDLDLVAVDGAGAFEVRFRGEPLSFVQVRLSGSDGEERTGRSDAAGRVHLPLAPGRWILSAVHLQPTGTGEWQSWWSSFLFDVEDARPADAASVRTAG